MRKMLWIIWIVATLVGTAFLSYGIASPEAARSPLFSKARAFLLPGKTTSGHYQIELACENCHASAFTDKEEMQKACTNCHAAELKASNDTHPLTKFTDPRNADRLEKLDATLCVTCHIEHRPHATHAMGVTLPKDLCFHCHSEIATDRPSHTGMSFETCNSAGCHKYHDNRALYEDFLAKRLDQPVLLAKAGVKQRDLRTAIAEGAMAYPVKQFPLEAVTKPNAPSSVRTTTQIDAEWLASAHAKGGVNCTGCHQPAADAAWVAKPDHEACARCHDKEDKGFLAGKHGMRIAAKLPPMSPAMAEQPTRKRAHERELGCASCHSAHRADTKHAAVRACVDCHDDKHTQAYIASPHYRLWQEELAGKGPAGSGVSCSTCHLPRVHHEEQGLRRVLVQHNQNDNLRPSEKMLRSVCMNCHGLGFSIDALADPELVERNFAGKPKVHIRSLDLVAKRLKEVEERRK